MKEIVKISLFLIFVTVSLSHAQEFGGIKGTVTDGAGVPLSGVNVTLDGSKIALVAVITSQGGHFRFLNLPAADDYVLKIEMPGFKTLIREELVVSFARDVILAIVLEESILEEEIRVIGKTPVIDTKRAQVGVIITDEMIMSLPTARNPFVIMALVPGIFLTKEDVGGNEAGQQPGYVGHGVDSGESTWSLDGNFMYAGSAFAYINLASYEQMQIDYGSTNIMAATGGVQLNFITRRGGNRFSGMFYLDAESADWQAENITPELEEAGYIAPGINRIYLYGANFGGPIVRDRAWFYGSWGIQDLDVMTLSGTSDKTWLASGYFKLNFQLTSRTKMELFLEYDNKQKWNRAAYADYARSSPESLWNQEGPGYIWKGELEHTVGNLFLNLKVAYRDGWWGLTSVQGQRTPDGSGDYLIRQYFPDFYVSGAGDEFKMFEDQLGISFMGNYFAEGVLGADHEIKFGVDYVTFTMTTFDYYEGNLALAYWGPEPSFPTGEWWEAWLNRDYEVGYNIKNFSAFLQDTLTFGRWAVNLGLTYGRGSSWINDADIPASPWLPQYMPAVKFDRIDTGVKDIFLSPRLSLIYDITGDGKNVVKFSIARYGSAGGDAGWFIDPIGWSEIDVIWQDLNGDSRVTAEELFGLDWETWSLTSPDNPDYWLWFTGVNTEDPSDVSPRNRYDPDWKTPILDEVTLSYERELFPDFSARLEFFYKKSHRESWDKGLMYVDDQPVIETKENYFFAGHDDTVDYDYYGRLVFFPYEYRTNHEKRFTRYLAGQIVLTKRLSNKWMLNGSFTYSDWSQHFNGEFLDPTFVPYYDETVYADGHTGKNEDGETGRGYNSRWMFKLSGLYQAPLGINVSWVFTAREGFILPTYVRVYRPGIGWTALPGNPESSGGKFGDQRLPDFWMLSLRVEKVFQITETSTVALAVDAFNVNNAAHSLNKESQIDSPNFGQDLKILNPRVFRFGVRFSF